MGVYGFWWFFKIDESDWAEIKSEFDQAVLAGVLAGAELGLQLFHRPFQELTFKILQEKPDWRHDERLVELARQSRVLPTVVLWTGIGRERFAQLPGYLGNMLLHPQDVASAKESVSRTLDVDWESYSAKAKCTLDYGGPPGSDFDLDANRDVAEILHALPNALQRVLNDQAGLLVLSSWGAPDTDTPQDLDAAAEEDDIEF